MNNHEKIIKMVDENFIDRDIIESTEKQYLDLIKDIIDNGELKETRNGRTKSIFGAQIHINELKHGKIPLLTSRKHFFKGIVGEYAAFLRGPKSVQCFEEQGCNYWHLWANEDGSLKVDYGNAWKDFDGINQIDYVLDLLKNDPNSRRMIINAWHPNNVINKKLSLECCHYCYQFHVSEGKYLNLKFIQRSVDTLIGMPSDLILASLMVMTFAKASGLEPGKIIMDFTDVHIYEEHLEDAKKQLLAKTFEFPTFSETITDNLYDFKPDMVELHNYQHSVPIKYLLKA